MGILLGTSGIDNISWGDSDVASIWWGNTQVYTKETPQTITTITFSSTADFTNNFSLSNSSCAVYNMSGSDLHFAAYGTDQFSTFYRGLASDTTRVDITFKYTNTGTSSSKWEEHYFAIDGTSGSLLYCPRYGQINWNSYASQYLCYYPIGNGSFVDAVSAGMWKGATVYNSTTTISESTYYTISFRKLDATNWGVYKNDVLIGQGAVGTPTTLSMNPLNGWYQTRFHFYFTSFTFYQN